MESKFEEKIFQGLVGEVSFSIILSKDYAIGLGIQHGDFVKVRQEEYRIVIEKAQNEKINTNTVNIPALIQEIHNHLVKGTGKKSIQSRRNENVIK
jgi:formylmethanofuran dehydrogenase subunit D